MSNTTTEYELTFLAREIPAEVRQALPERLVDIYVPDVVPATPVGVLRLRRKGNTYEITKKTPLHEGDFSEHTEQTIPLTQAEFESLSNGHARSVEKDRYRVIINGRPAYVDVFSGKLEGLVLIEFEFLSPADKQAFTPPPCCLFDVTQEEFVLGGTLAGKSYADIETELTRFGYQALHL